MGISGMTSNSSQSNPNSKGAQYAKKRKRLECTDLPEVWGLRLGRYPFAGGISHYLEKRFGTIAESTYREEERKLKYLSNVFENLKSQGKIESTDPRRIGRKDIQEFLFWMKRGGLDPTAQAKYIQYLNGYLKTFRNFVLVEMKSDGIRLPREKNKPIRTIKEDDLLTIFESLESMEGWQGSVAKGMISLYFATGARPKEGRLAHTEDLDLKKTQFYIRHPKGEGSWASSEWVEIIRLDMVPFLKLYLKERDDYLISKDQEQAIALFPALGSRSDGFYREQSFWKIKRKVEEISGIEFRLKDFRSTLTTITINGDISRLPAMSVQLRHSKLETTQKYYASIERGLAGKQLRDAWKENPIRIHENTVIEFDNDYTGYV
jgi:integrase